MLAYSVRFILGGFLFVCASAFAGDLQCYGYTSTTSHFACGTHGNCTWWAAYKRPDLASAGIYGNGGEWYKNAQDLNFLVGSDPRKGAIVEFSYFGHVAYVEKVHADGSFDVTEMDATGQMGSGVLYATYNPHGDGTYRRNNGSTRWILKGFIYKTSCDFTKEWCEIRVSGSIGWFPSVSVCSQASQWFIIGTVDGERIPIGTGSVANCPQACVPSN